MEVKLTLTKTFELKSLVGRRFLTNHHRSCLWPSSCKMCKTSFFKKNSHSLVHFGFHHELLTFQLLIDTFRPHIEEDDQRKRRRKKERSSIFFRKKKDKTGATNVGSKTSFQGPPAQFDGVKNLSKVRQFESLCVTSLKPEPSYSRSILPSV